MAELYAQYTSGIQFTAGAITQASGTYISGINPIVNRLNSITSDDGAITSNISGTSSIFYGQTIYTTNIHISGNHYWSCPGNNFIPNNPYTESVSYSTTSGTVNADTLLGTMVQAPVTGIPGNATIIGAIVYGSSAGETWALKATTLSNAITTDMASANVNTEDTTISGAVINNGTYAYWFATSVLDQNVKVYSARITYTI